VPEALVAALEDDLNTPKALAEFFALARKLNKATDPGENETLAAQMYAAGNLMGLLSSDPEECKLNKATDPGENETLAAQMYAAGNLMGLLSSDPEEWFSGHAEGELTADEIEVLIEKRNVAKKARDFEQADAIRDQLAAAGITIQDGRDGTIWRRGG